MYISRVHAIALFFGVIGARLLFSLERKAFDIAPDEPANLAMARWLSGHGHWNMFDNATFRPGLATLLAPVFFLTDDPVVVFRIGLVVLAMCAGASALVLTKIGARLTDLPAMSLVIACGVIALLPASLSASSHLWPESLVTLLFLIVVWRLMLFCDRPSSGQALLCVTLSVASYTVHGRLLPLFVATLVLTVVVLSRNRAWGAVGIVLATSAMLLLAATWYVDLFYDELWTEPADFNTFASVASRLTSPLEVVRSSFGQAWYLLVTSLGLIGIGVAATVAGAAGGADSGRVRDHRIVIATFLPLFALSAVFMSNRDRVDQLVYGRYNDAVVWPLLLVGVAAVGAVRGRRWKDLPSWVRWAIVAIPFVLISAGLVVAASLRGRSRRLVEFVDMIAGLAPVVDVAAPLPVLWITAGALALFGLATIAAMRSTDLVGALAAVLGTTLLVASGISTQRTLGLALDLGAESEIVRDIEDRELPTGADVVYGFVPQQLDPGVTPYVQRYYSQLYQWYLPDHRFRLTRTGDYGTGTYVFAPTVDRILLGSGYCVLWQDPAVPIALWYTDRTCPS